MAGLLEKYANLYFDKLVECNELKLKFDKLQYEKEHLIYENQILNLKIKMNNGYESENLAEIYPGENY